VLPAITSETGDQDGGPGWPGPDRADCPTGQSADARSALTVVGAAYEAAAVAAYRASLDVSEPLSERKLAARFGRTSR
jgi:hypothetical protein